MHVRLFTRDECSLCDAWKLELLDLEREVHFTFEELSADESVMPSEVDRRTVPIVSIEADEVDPVWLQPPQSQKDLRDTLRSLAQERKLR